jgi:energy-converting hydrogenase Eha subunit H
MHVTLLAFACALSLAGRLLGTSVLPFALFAAEIVGVAASIGLVWLVAGRDVIRVADWLSLPVYVIAKIPGYLRLVGSKRRLGWKKTEREP